jgi:hypothetical protein
MRSSAFPSGSNRPPFQNPRSNAAASLNDKVGVEIPIIPSHGVAHMSDTFSSYPDWKAPSEDSQLLIWPEPPNVLRQTQANHKSLSSEIYEIQGVPLADLRRRQRQWLGLAEDQPVIADGHQTELYHPGVWSKLALLSAAAEKIGAKALHIAVDTDAPKHLNLRWPGGSEPITDDPSLTTAPWSALLPAPAPEYLNELKSKLGAAASNWDFIPIAFEFLEALREQSQAHQDNRMFTRVDSIPLPRYSGGGLGRGFRPPIGVRPLPQPSPGVPGEGEKGNMRLPWQSQASPRQSLSNAITAAMHKLDESLGLKHDIMPASPIFSSEPCLVLAHHLLSRAGEFAAAYNRALAEYRRDNGIRTPGRPMPDLQVSEDACEIPYWLDDLRTPARSRADIHRRDGGWNLVIAGDSFTLNPNADADRAAGELKDFLERHNARLSPRALTLTMFLRLLIADQFIHGIGGARYDQVTNRVIELFFKMQAPSFSVTTSTLYFPTALQRTRACLPCLSQEGHRLRHSTIGKQKSEYLHRIEQLPRGSKDRLAVFTQMHSSIAAALVADPHIRAWEERYAEVARQSAQDEVIFDRELFYAIQPKDRLLSMIARYRQQFA